MEPLVSVIVLCYENFNYVFQALDSVFQQDYSNIELIVFDDGSADFPETSIRTYIQNHCPKSITSWRISRNEENLGTVRCLNATVKAAKGDFFMSVSADDILAHPKVVSTYVQEISFRQDADILMAQAAMCGEKIRDIHYYFVQPHIRELLLHDQQSNALFAELAQYPYLPSVSTFFRRTFFEKYGYFDENYRLVEDWPLHLKIARLHIPIVYVDFVSVCHRSGGVSHRKKTEVNETYKQYLTDLQRTYEWEIRPYLDQVPPEIRKQVKRRHRLDAAWINWVTIYKGTGLKGGIQYLCRFFDIELCKWLPAYYRKIQGKQSVLLLAGLFINCFSKWLSYVIGYSAEIFFATMNLYSRCLIIFSTVSKLLLILGVMIFALYYIARLFVMLTDMMQLYF